jgi:hypothetical protein
MEPELHDILMEYVGGQGEISMEGVCCSRGEEFTQFAREQDEIRWMRFMEGMVCRQARVLQSLYHFHAGTSVSPEWWATGLIQKLMEATHRQ